ALGSVDWLDHQRFPVETWHECLGLLSSWLAAPRAAAQADSTAVAASDLAILARRVRAFIAYQGSFDGWLSEFEAGAAPADVDGARLDAALASLVGAAQRAKRAHDDATARHCW